MSDAKSPALPETRIARRFRALKSEGRAGLVTFVTAGDPTPEVSREIVLGLPAAGADLIEIGMPFSDPMADGPAIQASSLRALKAGMTVAKTLDLVKAFRSRDDETPVILMGYYNPIYAFGVDAFLSAARDAGVDGLIIVDLPPEEEDELCLPALEAGLNFIYLTAPTTDDARLPTVLEKASGFVYFVSITGITGTRSADTEIVAGHVERIRRHTDLPIGVGFGIRTADQVAEMGTIADAAVVGSALVDEVTAALDDAGAPTAGLADKVLAKVRELSRGLNDRNSGGQAA